MKHQEIIEDVAKLIAAPVYLVGGSVRDRLIGREAADYDFATPLMPDEVEAKVRAAGRRAYLIGKRFGTIGFKSLGNYVEVTTFRSENYTPGSRKPTVDFAGDINRDLGRRDFTINAIAERNNKIIDPFGGQADIAAGLIRPVGKGSERIREDPLRMLRAARFAAQLGFDVDPAFIAAMQKNAHRIATVSRERWVIELDKLLSSDQPSKGLRVLAESNVLKFVLPELAIQVGYDQNSPYHDLTLWEHTLATVDSSPNELNLRWAALLHDVGKPFVRTDKTDRSNYIFHDLVGALIVEGILSRLRLSNARQEVIVETVRNHLNDSSPIRAADNASKVRQVLQSTSTASESK